MYKFPQTTNNMQLNQELIVHCFQQQSDKIIQMSVLIDKHEKQNLMLSKIIEKQQKQIDDLLGREQNSQITEIKDLKKKFNKDLKFV